MSEPDTCCLPHGHTQRLVTRIRGAANPYTHFARIGTRRSLVRGTIIATFLLAFTASALAAQPYQWTPAQAAAEIRTHGEELYVEPEYKLPKDLIAVTCRGSGRRLAGGRFVAFRCPARFEGTTLRAPDNWAIIWAKTRKAGGLCWSTVSMATVPSGCLASGARARGSVDDAFRAMVQKVGTVNHSFRCVANGAGFFSCEWWTGTDVHRGTVVFVPRAIVRVLS